MFLLPNAPSPQAEVHELADFAELLCLEKRQTSEREIVAYLGRVDDNEYNEGCDDEADDNASLLDDVMNEIDRRSRGCGTGYPFVLQKEGTTLEFQNEPLSEKSKIYIYLLLSTRLNMRDNRVHDNIDGTHLLEELAAHVLRNYLGSAKAKSLVVGTSAGRTFEDRVETICQQLCEGAGFRSLDEAPVHAQDDKLDAIAWIPFSDSLPCQLIVFCQCKTGTSWNELVGQLQPDVFVKKWMREPILVNPLRAFCISEACSRATWKGTGVATGVLFDRCRIVDFCDNVDGALLSRIERWTKAARQETEVPRRQPRVPRRAQRRRRTRRN